MTHIKIPCEGFAEAPTKENVHLFLTICRNFLLKPENSNLYIGLHCTHGFNRTGFLICSYLVEENDWDVQTAVAAFAQARPPGIYKRDYVEELYRRYDGDLDSIQDEDFYRPNWEDKYERVEGDDLPESSNLL